jgi:hypothetical protein
MSFNHSVFANEPVAVDEVVYRAFVMLGHRNPAGFRVDAEVNVQRWVVVKRTSLKLKLRMGTTVQWVDGTTYADLWKLYSRTAQDALMKLREEVAEKADVLMNQIAAIDREL